MVEVFDDESGEEDFEGYEPEYHPEADEAGELWCPLCGAVIHAEASICPKCGEFMTPGLPPAGSMPRWRSSLVYWILFAIVGGAILSMILAT